MAKRQDRLVSLIQILRDGRLHRAEHLAQRLSVSQRSIYRDMTTLRASGVPVSGTPGLGYQMQEPVTLPPLNLTLTELEAFHLGMAVVGEGGDPELQEAARSLSAKVDAVLPEDRTQPPTGWGFAMYPFADVAMGFQFMPVFRNAIRARQKVQISYDELVHTLRPLALDYWGRVWTCTAWSETIQNFAVYRLDKMETVEVMPQLFVEEAGKTLIDFRTERGEFS